MEREIKFRGVSIDTDKMVYGDLLQYRVMPVIFDEDKEQWEVKAETVGQFTGLFDKNGEEIYEGDILQAAESVIIISYSGRGFQGKYINNSQKYDGIITNNNYLYWEIIGNIHKK